MFKAVLLGNDFANMCTTGCVGEVHSVFERAVNIQISDGRLFTVLCEGADIMPASCLATAPPAYWEKTLSIGDRAALTPNVVYVNNTPLAGGISSAGLWQRLANEEIYAIKKPSYTEMLVVCGKVRAYIDSNKSSRGSLSELLPIEEQAGQDPLRFIGLGDGLTPAGDDFLAGVLYGKSFAERLYGKENPGLRRLADIIAENLHRTGTISRHFLRYAIKGEWGRCTENFLTALAAGESEELYRAVDAKMSYGASSGESELRGGLFGIESAVRGYGDSACS